MTRSKHSPILHGLLVALTCSSAERATAQAVELVPVIAKQVSRTVDLPGEFQPFLSVSLHAKVQGFVERVTVDRGSAVKAGQLLVELSAPEMATRIAEAESRVRAAEADRLQAVAQLGPLQSTYERLKKAAETPGAIAANEIVQLEKQMEVTQALIRSRQQAIATAEVNVTAAKEMQSYLRITAPFDGVVTDRLVHPGALVGAGSDGALLVIQQISRLRLVVALPEEHVGGIVPGAKVAFRVPAFPERTFSGTVARLSHSLDTATRTMAVELDVPNQDGALAPGMYSTVKWPILHSGRGLFVPKTSVVITTEHTFVVRAREGRAEWVDVRRGAADSDLIEVMGGLKAGDMIVRRASDEIRDGSPIPASSPASG